MNDKEKAWYLFFILISICCAMGYIVFKFVQTQGGLWAGGGVLALISALFTYKKFASIVENL